MAPATEEMLAIRAKAGDEAAAAELSARLSSWVVKVVFKLASYAMPLEDLTQHGTIGLLQATASYDIRRGVRFRTHAISRVRGAALDACRASGSAIVRVSRTAAKNGQAYIKVRPLHQPHWHLVERDTDDEFVIDPPVPPDPLPGAELEALEPYLKSCSPIERAIVIGYYVEGVSMKVIGQRVGLSESRISQMHSRLLARLRAKLEEENGNLLSK